jgi:hypothetical protein
MDIRVTTMFSFHRHKFIVLSAIFWFWTFSSSGMAGENSKKGWLVQLNSFHDEKNAERFISGIKKKGYTPFVVKEQNSQWYKVRVGPYPSKEEALQVVQNLKKNQGVSAMVILSKEGPLEMGDSGDSSGDSIDVVVSQLLIWLKAWEQGDVKTYLSFYSQHFQDPNKTHEEWIAQRHFSLSRNSAVSIQISDIEMKQNDETVDMSFVQNFKSDKVADTGWKQLVWKNEGNGWKIVAETWKPI